MANIKRPSGAIFLNPHAYSIDFKQSVFTTTAYFDYQGIENSMPADYSFLMSDTDINLAYGFSSNLEMNSMLRFRYVSSQTALSTNGNSITKMGLESAQVGLKYQLEPINNNFYAIGAKFRQTLYTNLKYDPPQSAPTDKMVLGDDGSEYSIDLYSTFLYKSSRLDGNLSYVKPPNNLSQELQYKGEYLYQFTGFGGILGVEGIISLKKDPYVSDPNLKPKISTGATSLFNSTNRQKMAPYFGALYDMKKSTFEVRGGAVISGVSTDKGYFASVNVNFNSDGVTKEFVKIESFKEYQIDGSVLKISARGTYVKIDQGLSTDVEKGMAFDIYQTDYFGGNVLVASGVVFDIGSDWSIIKVTKKYNDIEIKPGFAARGK
jgi:hypothetical protein